MKQAILILLSAAVFFTIGWIAEELGWLPNFPGISPGGASSAQGPVASGSHAASAPASGQRPNVVALGRLEPLSRVIDVTSVAGQRLDTLMVEENKPVEKGQTLALLDSHPLRRLELEAAEAQLQEAKTRRTAVERLANARIAAADVAVQQARAQDLEIAAQQAQITLLKKSLELAQSDQKRMAGLPSTLVSDQEHEHQGLVVEKAQRELEAAQAVLAKTVRLSQLAVQAAEAELAAARANKEEALSAIPVESLTTARKLAQAQFDRTVVVAPSKGVILKIFTRPGELLGAKPLLQMGDLQEMVAVAEVYETEVQRIREGQSAQITSSAFSPPYNEKGLSGTVRRIGKLVMIPGLKSLDPMAAVDRHVVEVVVALGKDSEHAADFTNLQVNVTFPPTP